jgi:hypothetical protein
MALQIRYTGDRARDMEVIIALCGRVAVMYCDENTERAEAYAEALTAMAFLSRMIPTFSLQDPRELIRWLERPMDQWLNDAPPVVFIEQGRPTEHAGRVASLLA